MDGFLQVPHLIARTPSAHSSVDSVSTTVSLLGNRFIADLRFGAESADVWSLGAAAGSCRRLGVRRVPARVGAPCQRGAFSGLLLAVYGRPSNVCDRAVRADSGGGSFSPASGVVRESSWVWSRSIESPVVRVTQRGLDGGTSGAWAVSWHGP